MQLDSSKSEEAKKKREEEEKEARKEEKEARKKREEEEKEARKKWEKRKQIMENLLHQLPEELSNSVKRHIYLDLLKKVSSLISYDKLAI